MVYLPLARKLAVTTKLESYALKARSSGIGVLLWVTERVIKINETQKIPGSHPIPGNLFLFLVEKLHFRSYKARPLQR
jgi:hypothetical protein